MKVWVYVDKYLLIDRFYNGPRQLLLSLEISHPLAESNANILYWVTCRARCRKKLFTRLLLIRMLIYYL